MASNTSWPGINPASDSGVALTMIMNRMAVLLALVSRTRRARRAEIDRRWRRNGQDLQDFSGRPSANPPCNCRRLTPSPFSRRRPVLELRRIELEAFQQLVE